jgi:protein regulator of cytokinesis 1
MATAAAPDRESAALLSLLDFLHTHLQTQTTLLPTLHAQLGLPPSALEDELSNLQQQLAECVDTQIDARRGEVNEWMGRCDAVERECTRYVSALGGNVKAAGQSLGEMRKEKVLPRRYELVTAYQEKLRQVHWA